MCHIRLSLLLVLVSADLHTSAFTFPSLGSSTHVGNQNQLVQLAPPMCKHLCVANRRTQHKKSGLLMAEQPQWSRPGQLGLTAAELARRRRSLESAGLRDLPRVFPAEELLNRAINRALEVPEDLKLKNPRQRFRKLAAERSNVLSKELTKPLGTVLDGYKKVFRTLQPFERVVADLTVESRELSGFGSLQETLDGMKELRKNTLEICKEAAQAGKQAATRRQAEEEMDICFASIEELWFRDGWLCDQLLDMGKELRAVPMLDRDLETVVLVGSPNVGKSSIVRSISTGLPEVNNYPFTTRGMTLGHIMDDDSEERICQIMDTPGLLPRKDDDRNLMEQLTLASMEYLDGIVLFVMDLTGGSGEKSSIFAQAAVRRELKLRFPDLQWIDVVSKADLPMADEGIAAVPDGAIKISSETGEGLAELVAAVNAALQRNREIKEEKETIRRSARV